jgi:hypothetical protein
MTFGLNLLISEWLDTLNTVIEIRIPLKSGCLSECLDETVKYEYWFLCCLTVNSEDSLRSGTCPIGKSACRVCLMYAA